MKDVERLALDVRSVVATEARPEDYDESAVVSEEPSRSREVAASIGFFVRTQDGQFSLPIAIRCLNY